MKESDLCLEIKHSLEKVPGVFVHKIPDSPRFITTCPRCKCKLGEKMRFAVPRPFDIFAIYEGHHIAFEVKLHKSTQAFPIAAVSEWQVQQLSLVHRAKGTAGILWGYRSKDYRFLGFLPIDAWVNSSAGLLKYEGRKSFPVDDLMEDAYEIQWLGKGLWDFEPTLNFFLRLKKNP